MIEVELVQEDANKREPAHILIREDGKLITDVIAKVDSVKGADGGYYATVLLSKKE